MNAGQFRYKLLLKKFKLKIGKLNNKMKLQLYNVKLLNDIKICNKLYHSLKYSVILISNDEQHHWNTYNQFMKNWIDKDNEYYDNPEISDIRSFNQAQINCWAEINCAIWILDMDFRLPVKFDIYNDKCDLLTSTDLNIDNIFELNDLNNNIHNDID